MAPERHDHEPTPDIPENIHDLFRLYVTFQTRFLAHAVAASNSPFSIEVYKRALKVNPFEVFEMMFSQLSPGGKRAEVQKWNMEFDAWLQSQI
jgi:hypothetical protein